MADEIAPEDACYVFDASSLIELEGADGKGLRRVPAPPGRWLVVPSKVAKEVNNAGAHRETKRWFSRGRVSRFTSDQENRLYMELRVNEASLDDPDIEGIVIAYHRGGIYVVDEGPAGRVARRLGVRIMTASQFLDRVRPRLL